MNIVKYIIEILKDNGKVVVPGLGNFVIEHNAAKIHPVEHKFTPPAKSVIFNSSAPEDDLLASKISEQEKITTKKALEKIKKFSDDLVSGIQKDKTATVEGLGVFSLTADDLITFAPDTANFSDEEFGLTGFTSPAILRTEFKDKAAENAQKEKDEKEKHSKNSRTYLTVTAFVITITALIFLVFFTDIFRNYMYNNDVNAEPKIEEIATIDEVTAPVQAVINDSVDIADEDQPTDTNITPLEEIKEVVADMPVSEIPQDGVRYYLIAGSFSVEGNANKNVLTIKNKGYKNAGIMPQTKSGMHIVYYESYTTKAVALKALRKIRRAENPDSWMLKK